MTFDLSKMSRQELIDLRKAIDICLIPQENPLAQSVEQQLIALRRANEEQRWHISKSVFRRLIKTAPEWPKGRFAFRSLRIRFGEGDEGVKLTFNRHFERIEKVLNGMIISHVPPSRDMRLLVGNHTHKPTIEWIIIDLDSSRYRKSIRAMRGSNSLADELLTFTWLFPNYIRSINYTENPGLIAGGYEMNVSDIDGDYYDFDDSWHNVPYVDWIRREAKVKLYAHWPSNDNSNYSIPVVRE